jgi:thioredoxin reductase (NADPH)
MEQLIIIGSGPAGMTAAIYAARAGLAPLVLSGTLPGGQLTQTTLVENYPGFPEGVQGYDLMEAFKKQAAHFGARFQSAAVTACELRTEAGPHTLTLDGGEPLTCRALIIATGATPRWLGLPAEEALKTKGVSSCATCDGAFFRNVPVAVAGGGDSALEEALFLTRFASRVHLLHRRDRLRGSQIMQDRVRGNAKIEIHWNTVVADILDPAAGKVTGLRLRDTASGAESALACGALFVAIGHDPSTGAFRGQLETDAEGYLRLPGPGTATAVPGVFAAGDCVDHVYQQAVTAAGQGCQAAIEAERWLAAQPPLAES